MKTNWKYRVGDLLAGALIGVSVAIAHRLLVPHSPGLVGSAFIGMFVGMSAQMLASVLLGTVLGQVELMIPGMFVGMLGMILPVFQLPDLATEILSGAAIGSLVFLAFMVWDARVQGTAQNPQHQHDSQRVNPTSAGGWNRPAWLYDVLEKAGSHRHAPFQRELFGRMDGRTLFVAAGTGLNFSHFPRGKEIVAVEISPQMLEAARARAKTYDGSIIFERADAQQLPFADSSFDTAATASTFCSVPDPVQGLGELYRVLKPGGRLLMYEHVRSMNFLVGIELDLLTLATRRLGPAMNRDTAGNVRRAGFVVKRVTRAYLDIFVAIEAHKPTGQAEVAERSS